EATPDPFETDKRDVAKLLAEGDQLATKKDYAGALLSYKDAYEKILADFRGRSFKKAVRPKLMDRDELAKYLAKSMKEEYDEAELYLMDRTFKAFRLVPESLDVSQAMTDLFAEGVAGFYDSEKKTLVLIQEKPQPKRKKTLLEKLFGSAPEFDKDEQRSVLAHEMTHALQDQHFDLEGLHRATKHDDEMSLALSALVEGEATLAMLADADDGLDGRSMLRASPRRVDMTFHVFRAVMPFASGAAFRKAPGVLRESMIFPYHKGTVFVLCLTNRDGWKSIDAAFRDPPASTEQILHPKKYYEQRDEPTAVELPDLKKSLGDGWKKLGGNVLGEFQTAVMFDQVNGGQKAAAGWDGDAYQIWEDDQKRSALAWFSTWDSPGDAQEF
ncbi:MAG: hypothetical protein N2C14_07950, partial [Planctomycetales bacterium]